MKLFIGCSSRMPKDSTYVVDCQQLLQRVAQLEDIELVFGAHHEGLMGLSYDTFLEQGRKVIGIRAEGYPSSMKSYDQEYVMPTATSRFEKVYECCDVLLFLPGGLGTYAEIFSAIEEGRCSTGKKIILYNDQYFYTPLIQELYRLYQEGFVSQVPADYMEIESDIESIINLIKKEIN